MQTILIGFIIGIFLGYLLIFGLAHAASKRREAWQRANKQEWETWSSVIDRRTKEKEVEPGRQAQWEELAEICKQETINDIENLR